MYAFILTQGRQKIKRKLGAYAWTVMVLVLCLSVASTSGIKYWEYYDEISGTIRRVEKKWLLNKWRAQLWLLSGFIVQLAKLTLLNAVLYLIDLWGALVFWLTVVWLAKDVVEKIEIMTYRSNSISLWFHDLSMRMTTVAITVVLFVSVQSPLEASCEVAVAQAASVGTDIATLIAANCKFFDVPLGKRYKLTITQQQVIYRILRDNSEITTKELISCTHVEVSISQLNRIRKEWKITRKPGRPRCSEEPSGQLVARGGLKIFSIWLEGNEKYQQPLEAIYSAIECHREQYPDDKFRLLYSKKETIAKKWKALMVLSLLGIKRLSELDYCPHNLPQILGYSYGYSTLRQFLGELERIEAGCVLRSNLCEAASGTICYIDPHLFPYWTRIKMHKGLITNRGRIMAGSKVLIAHDQEAQAIAFQYHPPDTHLNKVIEGFCANIVEWTGIKTFVIDREVNAVETARMFEKNGWELLCMLDSNEYKGLDDFNKRFCKRLDDGTTLYKAAWNLCRHDDPRKFMLAHNASTQKLLVYWGTCGIISKFTAEESAFYYHLRTEIQENSFKDMISHGAFDVNYGRKTIQGPDRSHQRKVRELEAKIETSDTKASGIFGKINHQLGKIFRSMGRNCTELARKQNEKLQNLIEQRKTCNKNIEDLNQQKTKLGPTPLRADRDFRKQEIMTYRSLWLENQLKKFQKLLALPESVDIETILQLFFYRTTAVFENKHEIRVRFDTQGLSRKYRELLNQIIASFNRISLVYKGKSVRAELVGFI